MRTLVLIERDVPLVSHTTKSGKVYLRSEQYPRGYRGWSDRNVLHWSGTSAQSGRSMFGTLEDIYASVPHARYIERVYSGNQLETEIVMGCELDQNGELLVDMPPVGIIHAEARTLPPSMLGLWCDAGKVDKDTIATCERGRGSAARTWRSSAPGGRPSRTRAAMSSG